MKAADIMTIRVVTVTAETTIRAAARAMMEHRVSGLPVVDGSGGLIGMVTEGDLLRRAETGTERRHSPWLELLMGPGRLAQEYVHAHASKVGDVMTQSVISVSPETPLEEVVRLMERRPIKRVPVVENGRLAGIVSRSDLLSFLASLDDLPSIGASDSEIRTNILAEVDKQPWAPRASAKVFVRDGIVELHGAIADEREREALRVACENVPGVKAVHDHLIWVEPISGMVIDAPR